MAPTVPKFGPILHKGADSTAGVLAGSLVAATHLKTEGEYKISNNFRVMFHHNPACKKGNGPVVVDVAPTPLKVKRMADATKMADLIPSDNNNCLLDLKTVLATKPAAKPIITPPPYKGQDLADIGGRPTLVSPAWADKATNDNSASIKDVTPGVAQKP
jgi:hypothetical protein